MSKLECLCLSVERREIVTPLAYPFDLFCKHLIQILRIVAMHSQSDSLRKRNDEHRAGALNT